MNHIEAALLNLELTGREKLEKEIKTLQFEHTEEVEKPHIQPLTEEYETRN